MAATLSDKALKRLTNLLNIVSPSMQERDMLEYLKTEWLSVIPDGVLRTDCMGNIEFSVMHSPSSPTLALVAHTDTICIQITRRIGNSKFNFRSIGCSPHMLLGQKLVVVNEAGKKFDAVVGFDATSQFGQPKGLVFEDLWIDIPGLNHDETVDVGDLAVLKPEITINGDYITATALDDRLGLFIIGEILRWYNDTVPPVNLICVGTVQEEVGLRGSLAFEFSHKPDATIVLDVDYATDIPFGHEDQMGLLHLGKGPGLQRKADNSAPLRNLIKSVAARHNIPVQTSLGRFVYGGTDSTSLQVARNTYGNNIANMTLPCRYIHSPVETASISDVENAIYLIKRLIESFPKQSEFKKLL